MVPRWKSTLNRKRNSNMKRGERLTVSRMQSGETASEAAHNAASWMDSLHVKIIQMKAKYIFIFFIVGSWYQDVYSVHLTFSYSWLSLKIVDEITLKISQRQISGNFTKSTKCIGYQYVFGNKWDKLHCILLHNVLLWKDDGLSLIITFIRSGALFCWGK